MTIKRTFRRKNPFNYCDTLFIEQKDDEGKDEN